MAAVPSNLVVANQKWIIEVQDSEIYVEEARIGKITSPDHDIIIRAKQGQSPQIRPVRYQNAIELHYVRYVTIDGFTLSNFQKGSGVYLVGAIKCTVKNCTLVNGTYPAIAIYGGADNSILNNVIHHNALGIVIYYYSYGNIIKNNLLYKNSTYGFLLYRNVHHNIFENNTLFNNAREAYTRKDIGEGNLFTNNIIYNARQNPAITFEAAPPKGTVFSYNNIYAPLGTIGLGIGEHSISEDPLFVSLQSCHGTV
ncbi:MAG: right-handed parallel beta-helix repeat-containing protein [Deltaproteobacteria bacterium]|nr:right-handed parallel beta-helix repeat-containing protein [Deltaproteobacteria bacterium]